MKQLSRWHSNFVAGCSHQKRQMLVAATSRHSKPARIFCRGPWFRPFASDYLQQRVSSCKRGADIVFGCMLESSLHGSTLDQPVKSWMVWTCIGTLWCGYLDFSPCLSELVQQINALFWPDGIIWCTQRDSCSLAIMWISCQSVMVMWMLKNSPKKDHFLYKSCHLLSLLRHYSY